MKHISPVKKTILVLLPLMGAVWAAFATRSGEPVFLGDAPCMFTVARYIVDGISLSNMAWWCIPSTHPPFLSWILAAGYALGVDPVEGMRYLNIFLYAANILLVEYIILEGTGYLLIALIGAYFAFTSPYTIIYSILAGNDALFLFFSLAVILLFYHYLKKPTNGSLVLLSITTAAALLTKYAALPFPIIISLEILLDRTKIRKEKIRSVLQFLCLSLAPLIALLAYNKHNFGYQTGRTLIYHHMALNEIAHFVNSIISNLVPNLIIHSNIICITILVIVLAIFPVYRLYIYKRDKYIQDYAAIISNFVFIFLLFVLFAHNFAENRSFSIGGERHLYLTAVLIPLFLVCMLNELRTQFKNNIKIYIALNIVFALFIVMRTKPALAEYRNIYIDGGRFHSVRDLPIMKYLHCMPIQRPAITNAYLDIAYYTNRKVYMFPEKKYLDELILYVNGLPAERKTVMSKKNKELYAEQVGDMLRILKDENALVVYCNPKKIHTDYSPDDVQLPAVVNKKLKLKCIYNGHDGIICEL